LEKILYIWSIRHPASGYVQGINDLLTPFFQVYLQEHCNLNDDFEYGSLEESTVDIIEADSYWCLSKLLQGIQDNYTHGQPGLIRQVNRLQELVTRIDG
jgi:hypothetical protein